MEKNLFVHFEISAYVSVQLAWWNLTSSREAKMDIVLDFERQIFVLQQKLERFQRFEQISF